MREKFIACLDNGITVSLLSLALVLPFARTAAFQSAAYLSAALFWLIKILYQRKAGISFTSLFLPFLCFGITALFSVLTALSFRYSLHELRGEFATYLLIFLLASNNLKDAKKIFWLLLAIFSSSLIISTYGVIEYFCNGGRISSLLSDPNYLSAYLVMVLPFSISFWFLKAFSNRWGRSCCGLLSLLVVACIIFTLSRSAWLACLVELAVLALLCWRRREPWIKTGLKILLICLVAVFLVSTFTLDRARTVAKMPLQGLDSSGEKRIDICKFGLSLISAHPFSGIGYGKYSLYRSFSTEPLVSQVGHMHNIFLETALETGLPGLVCFIWLLLALGSNLKDAYRSCQEPFLKVFFLASFLALVGYMVRCQFDHLYVDNLVRLFWLLMGAAIGAKCRETA